jgi:Flp pilus assembly protein TadG
MGLLNAILRLRRERRGTAAVEFALVAPVVITLFIGTYEAASLVRAKMKFDLAAPTLANLVSIQAPVKTGTLTSDFCTGVEYLLAPFSSSGFAAQVNGVQNNGGTTSVTWTATCGSFSGGQTVTTLASGLLPNSGDSVVIVQTSYTYHAKISLVLASSYTFTNVGFARPRANIPIQFAP